MLEDLYSDKLLDKVDDIERVIEGGEDLPKNEESGNESENEGEKNNDEGEKEQDKVETKVKRKLGPRTVLNAERLKGPRGIGIMESFFSDIKLHGKGREREDLETVMGRLEHWTHRLFPRMQFDDCLKRIEKLGSKKEISNYVKRIRLGIEDDVSGEVPMDERPDTPPVPEEDPFDQLLASSVAAARPLNTEITTEQREQMLRNRLIAEERRAARIKRAQEMKAKFFAEHNLLNQNENSQDITEVSETLPATKENAFAKPQGDGCANHMASTGNISSKDLEIEKTMADTNKNEDGGTERNENQLDVIESNDNPPDIEMEVNKSQNLNVGVTDRNENQPRDSCKQSENKTEMSDTNYSLPDIVTERNKSHNVAAIDGNENQPDNEMETNNYQNVVLARSDDQPHIEMETNDDNNTAVINQTDIVKGISENQNVA